MARRLQFVVEIDQPADMSIADVADVIKGRLTAEPLDDDHPFWGVSATVTVKRAYREDKPRRSMRGTLHPRAKLTDEQVSEIRASLPKHEAELAKRFGVCRDTVSKIRRKRAWLP